MPFKLLGEGTEGAKHGFGLHYDSVKGYFYIRKTATNALELSHIFQKNVLFPTNYPHVGYTRQKHRHRPTFLKCSSSIYIYITWLYIYIYITWLISLIFLDEILEQLKKHQHTTIMILLIRSRSCSSSKDTIYETTILCHLQQTSICVIKV